MNNKPKKEKPWIYCPRCEGDFQEKQCPCCGYDPSVEPRVMDAEDIKYERARLHDPDAYKWD